MIDVADVAALRTRRLERWRQTAEGRITGPDGAVELIRRLGIVTLYPVSPEAPNLFSAYMGDPDAKTTPEWDSPTGDVYTWRWILGRQNVAFYGVLVRGRPTWVSWEQLPAVLRLLGELRMLDELEYLRALSPAALRVAAALESAAAPLTSGELREAARFPKGKEQRSAFLMAVQELSTRLLIAQVFLPEEDGHTRYALVRQRYPSSVEAAERLTREEALALLVRGYLPHAAYAVPSVLARHLRLDEAELRAAFERLVAAGEACATALTEYKGTCYVGRE